MRAYGVSTQVKLPNRDNNGIVTAEPNDETIKQGRNIKFDNFASCCNVFRDNNGSYIISTSEGLSD